MRLDDVDKLAPGAGVLDAYAFGRGDLVNGQIGASIEYKHRLRKNLSAFAGGDMFYQYGQNSGLGWAAMLGIRGTF